jgi:transcriptional regulator with XRE-family HTH domain
MTTLETDINQNVKWAGTLLALALTTSSVATPSYRLGGLSSCPRFPLVSRIGTSVGENLVTSQLIELESSEPSRWTVTELRNFSGLTAAQIGRLFGVSRRSINNWMAGNPMATHHEARLSALQTVFLAIPATTPETRRSALLDSSKGLSIFQQLANQAEGGPELQFNPIGARNQF